MGKKISEFFKLNIIKGDIGIWMIFFFLSMVSVTTIYSASSRLTFESGKHWEPVISQAGFLIVGFVLAVIVSKIPCKFFKLFPIIGLPIAAIMLVYVMVAKQQINDTNRWITMFGVSFQPSEIAKTMLILATAVILSKLQKEEKIKTKKGVKTVVRATKGGHAKAFKMVLTMALIICGLIMPENFSTAMMLFLVVVIMMFIGNVPKDLMFKGLAALIVAGVVCVIALIITPDETLRSVMKRAPVWKHRVETKLGMIEVDKNSQEYKDKTLQEDMSKVAIASSGIMGVGVGNSESRDFLPHAENDFIYSIIVEETGILGAVFLLLLFVMLLIRVGRIAQKCDRFFPAFLVIGLGTIMVIQAMVNMSVAVGLMPVTGQTLPLISHGGTSILITSFNFGMILSVSRYAANVQKNGAKVTKKIDEEETLYETNEIYSPVGMA